MAKDIKQLSDLTPDSHNANKGTERGQYMIEASLRKVGAGRSIVVDKDGRIIAGNKTAEQWAAMAESGDVQVVQTDGKKLVIVQRTDLDLADTNDTTARELAYYDNRSGEVSLMWDAEVLLADLAAEVPLNDFFFEDELDELIKALDYEDPTTPGADTEPDTSRAEELRAEWGTELGQMWQCGPHRLIIGDCTDADVVSRLMRGQKVDAVITDPPYGVDIDYLGFDDDEDAVIDLVSRFMPILLDMDCPILITPGQVAMWSYPRPTNVLAWVHPASTSRCAWGFMGLNVILAYGKDPYLANGLGCQQGHIVQAANRGETHGHPVEKPLAIWEWVLKRASIKESDTVFDPFLGSGTTMIAAHNLKRICYGCEISPAYGAVILQRYKDHTGILPELMA